MYWPDRIMSRLLFVETHDTAAAAAETTQSAERAFGLSLAMSGIRCVLQYVLLPFVLPVLGIAAEAAAPVYLGISLVAIVSIIASLRRFWKVRYHYRWQYLAMALVMLAMLAVFILTDISAMTTPQ